MKSVARSVCVFPLVIATSALAQQYTDDTFLDSTWSGAKLLDSTPAQDAIFSGIRGTGGNPGNCRTIAHNWQVVPAGVGITFGHWKSSLPLDPALFGRVRIAFDARCDSAPSVNAIGFGPLLVQGNKQFTAPGFAALAGGPWTNFETEVAPNAWIQIGGNDKPDFSSTGAPIYFGFYSSNGGSGFNARITSTGRVDNFLIRALRSCPADLNNDGVVEDADFSIFASAYDILDCADAAMPPGCPADLTFDGFVEDSDFAAFVGAYNELICP